MIDELKPYPAYRDSGVAWLGEVPAHWQLQRMKSVLRERSEKGHPHEPLLAATQSKGVVRKERYENRTVVAMKDLHLLKLVRVGDFVISLRSFQGGIEYAREQGIISPAYTVLTARDPDTQPYLTWLFKSRPYIEGLSLFVTGIRQGQNIDYGSLSRSEIPMPPHKEQDAIVRFLGHTDRRIRRYIRAKQRLIKLLEEQKQAAIQRAVTARPEANNAQGAPPGARARPGREAWSSRQVRTLAIRGKWSIVNGPFGSDLLTTELTASGVPVVYIRDISSGVYRRVSTACVTDAKAQQLAFCDVQPGDVLIAKVGDPPGTTSLYPDGAPSAIVTQDVVRLRPNRDVVLPEFLHLALNSPYGRDLFRSIMVESTRGRFGLNDFKGLSIALPPLSEQAAMLESTKAQLELVERSIRALEYELPLLFELRTRLVADIVTGKLDVREAAARLPDLPDEEGAQEPLDEELTSLDGDDADADALDPELQEV